MIAGIVLAAGSGSRFGGTKQLAQLDGIPLLEHALRAIEAVRAIDRIVVVLGARADEILAGIDFGAAEPVVCADWKEGQAAICARPSTSIPPRRSSSCGGRPVRGRRSSHSPSGGRRRASGSRYLAHSDANSAPKTTTFAAA